MPSKPSKKKRPGKVLPKAVLAWAAADKETGAIAMGSAHPQRMRHQVDLALGLWRARFRLIRVRIVPLKPAKRKGS